MHDADFIGIRTGGALGAVAPPIFYSPLCSLPNIERGLHTLHARCERYYLAHVPRMRMRVSLRGKKPPDNDPNMKSVPTHMDLY